MSEGEKIIGIDLGTTNSVVAVMEGGDVTVIPNQEGSRLTPSVVAFTPKGDMLVGDPAKRQAITNPTETIYSIKRFMGRRHDEVKTEEKMVPYKVVGGPNEFVKVHTGKKDYTPPEISAMILRKLKEAAESYLGHKVRKAVITVPAYFNDSQRQATKDAGQIAGLEVARIINEPTAAALAYGLDKKKNEKIAVFDLGGGTFDISILDVADGVFEVLSTNGDTHLGGDDWDEALINHIADEFKKEQGIDLRKDQMALQRLKEAAEKAKKDLSFQAQADINLPFITADASGPKHLTMTHQPGPVREADRQPVRAVPRPGARRRSRTPSSRPSNIDEVVLVGGSTRMPRVQQIVKDIFGKEPHKGVNPDEVVAVGAAIQGAVLTGEVKEVLLLDVTPLSLGLETKGGVMTVLVPRNTTIPTEKKETFTTADDNQTAVTIKVYQGERPMAADNRLLEEFNLEGIPPARMGVPKIEVSFNIDANGILNVTARDQGTGKEQTIRIEASGGLDKDEIERMKRDAESHAAEDKKRRELAEARNTAEQRVYQLEKLIEESKDKLSESDRAAVSAAIDKVNEAKKQDDAAAINRALDELQRASQAMAEHLYASGQAGPGRRREARHRAPAGRRRAPTVARAASPRTSSTSSSKRRSKPFLGASHGISIRAAHTQEPGGRAEAQALAQERGHPRLEPMHLLAALLHPEQQVVRSLLAQLGVNPDQILKAAEEGLNVFPKVSGGELDDQPGAQPGLRRRAGRSRADEGPVRLGRAPAAGPLEGQEPRSDLLEALGITEKEVLQALQKVRGGQRVTDQNPGGQVPGARALRPRPGRAGAERQDGPGDRPRFRDPPRDAGLSPADQEQPGPDRRAGRGQDGHRRGAGPADRLGRRAREPAKPPADRARHGGAGRRHQVPRRVRRAAQGRAQGGDRARKAGSSSSSTSCTWSSAPARPKGRWTPPTCSSRPWPAASCAASARPRSTSFASTSRKTRRSSGGSSRSSSASRRSRTRSRSSAG